MTGTRAGAETERDVNLAHRRAETEYAIPRMRIATWQEWSLFMMDAGRSRASRVS